MIFPNIDGRVVVLIFSICEFLFIEFMKIDLMNSVRSKLGKVIVSFLFCLCQMMAGILISIAFLSLTMKG